MAKKQFLRPEAGLMHKILIILHQTLRTDQKVLLTSYSKSQTFNSHFHSVCQTVSNVQR